MSSASEGDSRSPRSAGLSFEDALAELERIVRGLEGGQQKLEDAIAAYERGAALRRHCEAKLAEAEARVQAIVERADGSLALRPMECNGAFSRSRGGPADSSSRRSPRAGAGDRGGARRAAARGRRGRRRG